MSIVTVTISNRKFQLACNESAEPELHQLVTRLNEKIASIKQSNPNATFELLLVMTALNLQDRLQNMEKKTARLDGDKISAEDEKLAETLSTIAGYLQNIAQKIGK